MQEEKHNAALKEVDDAIEDALSDTKGLLHRQRLLMAALSLGMQHVVEMWLHKSRAIKPGATVKHDYFKSEERRLKTRFSGLLTKDIGSLKGSSRIISLARSIENSRDDIIYGAPLTNDNILREKIDAFFELKKAVKETVGEIQ